MKTVLEVLVEARALIAKGWTTGALYRNAEGHIDKQNAVCWCTLGAIEAPTGENMELYCATLKSLKDHNPQLRDFECIPDWNDEAGRMQKEVIGLFDTAIAAVFDTAILGESEK